VNHVDAAREIDVAVVGAGQAGLSAAYFLRRAGMLPGQDFVVLDHSPGPGGAWQFRWPSLTYGRAHRVHELPGMPLEGADPDRPSAEVVAEYFDRYERAFDLRVRRPVNVSAVRDAGDGDRLLVGTDGGDWSARALINATGTWDRPFVPRYPGQELFLGRQLHTAGYRGREEFAGKRVIVVGGGTSAVQLLLEIADVAAATTWVTRRPPVFHTGPFGEDQGRAAVALVEERVRQGLPPQSVVSVTGLPMTEAMAAARARGVLERLPMFDRLTPGGAVWASEARWGSSPSLAAGSWWWGCPQRSEGECPHRPKAGGERHVDADVVLWATGFRAALDHLAPLRLREPGGGVRLDSLTRVARDHRVHLIGYGPSASTLGANRAGRSAVREVRQLLRAPAGAVAVG
jgi:cation diffusion facilitator CzcD-associated flavoprotein CzcO